MTKMTSKLVDCFAQQMRLPNKSILGWIAQQRMKYKNTFLERNAARLSDIQPHHKVLEIGFGPGIGLQHAVEYVKNGSGTVHGLEASTYMIDTASARMRKYIHNRKLQLTFGSVVNLPYATDYFDRVFHCNCYYFWPSMQQALQEIYRVMKPGAFMVTTLNLDSIRVSRSEGYLKYGNPDPVRYMCALEAMGFEEVKIKYFVDKNVKYQAIFAYINDKPAYEETDQELPESKL